MSFLLPPRKVRAFLMGMDGNHGRWALAEESGRMDVHPGPITSYSCDWGKLPNPQSLFLRLETDTLTAPISENCCDG